MKTQARSILRIFLVSTLLVALAALATAAKDGRNGSKFGSIAWNGNTLTFTVTAATGSNGLRAMLPNTTAAGTLASLTAGGNPVTFTTETLKGITYAVFSAPSGSYVAVYAP